jgi:hypothetical protein
VLIAYVKACGGEQTEWEERWGKLMKASDKGQNALPAAGTDAAAHDSGPADGPRASAPGSPAPGPVQASSKSDEVYVITSAPERDDRW